MIRKIHTPANCTGYTHSTGAITSSSSVGLVHVFTRGANAMAGFVTKRQYREAGTSGSLYFDSETSYDQNDKVIVASGAGATEVIRPSVLSSTRYPQAGFLLHQCRRTAVATLLRTKWRTLGTLILRVVERVQQAAGHDGLYGLRLIGIDELSYRRHQEYFTVVDNHERRRIVCAARGKSVETLQRVLRRIGTGTQPEVRGRDHWPLGRIQRGGAQGESSSDPDLRSLPRPSGSSTTRSTRRAANPFTGRQS